ncbi:MAG: hypothetical protein KatS3mg102_0880 [Planctomycetota bacterium]|nr:MAG: hypothetical protein KatS3mg102_0880 [Planctomycetota bacterium]
MAQQDAAARAAAGGQAEQAETGPASPHEPGSTEGRGGAGRGITIEPPRPAPPPPAGRAAPLYERRGVPAANPRAPGHAPAVGPAGTRRGPEDLPLPLAREALVRAALADLDHTLVRTPFGFEVEVRIGARRQRVQVIYENADAEGDRVILVQTPCGPAGPENYRWALRLNLRLAYGRIAVRRLGARDHFVFVQTLLERHTQPAELRKAVKEAAERGDWIERQLTGGRDVH